jgi:hypothetical protein
MSNEPASSNAISAAALKIFSREELTQMTQPRRLSLMGMIGRRMRREDLPPPTQAELVGNKEMLDLVYPTAFEGLSGLSALSPQQGPETLA